MNAIAQFPQLKPLPSNIEAEQALLGAILCNNEAFGRVSDLIEADHFFEPLHQQIYAVLSTFIGSGKSVTSITVKSHLPDVQAGDVSLIKYLSQITAGAPSILNARTYAETIVELAKRRKIIEITDKFSAQSYEISVGSVKDIAGEALISFHNLALGNAGEDTRRAPNDSATMMIDRIKKTMSGELKDQFISTGYPDLDKATGGYRGGSLWVLGARPGMGKTTLAASAALKAAKRRHGVMFFSLEVEEKQLTSRLMADLAFVHNRGIAFNRIMRGYDLSGEEIERLEDTRDHLSKMPLIVDYASRLSCAEILMRIRHEKMRFARKGHILRVVFVDYLKQIKASDRYKGNRVEEIGEITAWMKQIAKDEDICVVLLAQVNRLVDSQNNSSRKDKRPDLSDLRGSGDLESDADLVAFIHRESYYIEKSKEYRAEEPEALSAFSMAQNEAELIIAKNRAGPTARVDLWCDMACSVITSRIKG